MSGRMGLGSKKRGTKMSFDKEDIEQKIEQIKQKYPGIDNDLSTHDGVYEYTKFIFEKYKNYNNDFSIKDLDFISNMGKLCYTPKKKIEYINNTNFNTDTKQELIKKIDEINTQYNNGEYTLEHDKTKTNFGLFGQGIASLEKNPKFKCGRTFPKKFIKLCINFIQEKNTNEIYDSFKKLFEREKIGSSGVISQILHCLKPDLFPVFNSVGMKLYKEYLPNNYMKHAPKTEEKVVPLNKYIDACRYLEKNCKPKWGINNYRIIDLIPQIQQEREPVDFSLIQNFLKKYAGQKYNKKEINKESEGKKATTQIKNFFTYLNNFLKENKLELCSKFVWQEGIKTSYIVKYFWYQIKHIDYKTEPYSLSILFYNDSNNDLYLCVKTEMKNNSPINIFNKSIDIKIPQGFIYEACNNVYDNINDLKKDVDLNKNKVIISKQIHIDINNKNNDYIDEIINSVESDLSLIIPNYMNIFNDGGNNMTKYESHNQILYGPPGTGKTYNTVVEAIKILDEKLYKEYKNIEEEKTEEKNEKYEELEKRFNKFRKDGRIEFVTFHQSYSYEEFVEGIKPYIPKDIWEYNNDEFDDYANDLPDVKYIGKKGIFREICKKAEEPIIEKLDNNIKLNENPQIWKVSLKQTGDNDIRTDCMNNNRIRIGFDKYGETITDETVFDNSGSRVLPAFINKMEIGDIVLSCYSEKTIDAIGIITSEYKWNNKLPEFKRYREVEWLVKGLNHDITKINNGAKFTLGTVYRLNNMSVKDVLDIVNEQKPVTNNKKNDKPYVLIIDEINRGNISKIFGELITLIEEDKRGKLKVRLPYSQDEFTVPENLYIIGTMNTSDRSIASVDIALRRRFTFKEMMPKPDLVADFGCNFNDIYKILNKKITILADRDHQIGHSYFIKDKHEGENINDLKNIWFDSVMPLLNEYFYGDWEKLQQILGKAEEEDDKKEEDKYTSFIKKISFKDLNLDTSCFDENCDCFDFVEDNKINFEGALKKAFYPEGDKKTDKKNSPEETEQEPVEKDTEE